MQSNSTMPQSRQAHNTPIDPPQLPPHLPEASFAPEQIADHAAYTQQLITRYNVGDQAADDVLFEQVVFKQVQWGQTQFSSAQFIDVRFDACDLAGAAWEKAHMQRAELIGCRLVGTKLLHTDWDNVLIKDCNAELALFWEASLLNTRWERCSLREASFEGANLAGVVFRNCDLTNADLRNTTLRATDLRGSTLTGMQVGAKELRGAIIDPMQAVHLARLLGVTVCALDDD